MRLRDRLLTAIIPLAVVACDGKTLSTPSPTAPSSTVSALQSDASSASRTALRRDNVRVAMFDACEADSFNSVLGPGTCSRNGGMQFDQFTDILTRLGVVGPWHFAPSQANVPAGVTFVATNQGGETHTFTEVEAFGGGIVPSLNQLAHKPTVAPECKTLEGDDFVPPGGTYSEQVSETGTVKFQCCIHPWMTLEAHVAGR